MMVSMVWPFMGAPCSSASPLARTNVLPRADAPHQLADQLGTLAIEHLPADDLAAEQILDQVKVLAAHLG